MEGEAEDRRPAAGGEEAHGTSARAQRGPRLSCSGDSLASQRPLVDNRTFKTTLLFHYFHVFLTFPCHNTIYLQLTPMALKTSITALLQICKHFYPYLFSFFLLCVTVFHYKM